MNKNYLFIFFFVAKVSVAENVTTEASAFNSSDTSFSSPQQLDTHVLISILQKQLELVTKSEENNRRIIALEWQNKQTQKALEDQKKISEDLSRKLEQKEEQIRTLIKKQDRLRKNMTKSFQQNDQRIGIIQKSLNETGQNLLLSETKISELQTFVEEEKTLNKNVTENLHLKDKKIAEIETKILPKDCLDVLEHHSFSSGLYLIRPRYSSFKVFCDMKTRGGGWVVVQNRFDGSQNFDLGWYDYRGGFGDLEGEFWLGLDYLHQLSGKPNELLFELVDQQGNKTYAHYSNFTISSDEEGYSLKTIGTYEGTAGDSFSNNTGSKFSTKDRDRDKWHWNCASDHGGGWWYVGCGFSNLNGKYLKGAKARHALNYGRGLHWYNITEFDRSLLKSKMMIRPK